MEIIFYPKDDKHYWWIYERVTCQNCEAVLKLELEDRPFVPHNKPHGEKECVLCPFCRHYIPVEEHGN